MRKIETDRELVEGCLKNDRTCQKILYDRFASKMLGVCMRYTRSKEEAEDILIEGFMNFFNSLQSYRFECSLESWIRRIMINNAISHFRANKKRNYISFEYLTTTPEQSAISTPVDKVVEKDLQKLIQLMPPGYQIVFNLFAIEGYSHKEIASQLGISESTSKSQFFRARKWLSDRLEK